MIFRNVFKSNPIQRFEIEITSSAQGNTVAFGPASVINGSVRLLLDKPIRSKSIHVKFKCEEWDQTKEPSVLFLVDSCVWRPKQNDTEILDPGSHIYLFAIQLPSRINYPPSIKDAYTGHRIEYSLQAFLSYLEHDTLQERATSLAPLTYLPLVTFEEQPNQRKEKIISLERNDYIKLTANLSSPSSCPGDLCSVKLVVQNHSSHTIHQVHALLLSTVTSLYQAPDNTDSPIVSSGPSYHHKQRSLVSESCYVSIPKYSSDHTIICPLRVPSSCTPTTQSHFGKYIDIAYEVLVVVSDSSSSQPDLSDISQLLLNPYVIRLPLFISTMPPSSHLPPKLQIPFITQDNVEMPNFIKPDESPLPSPSGSYSPSGGSYCNWEPGSPVEFDLDHNRDLLPQMHEDATGHLMVPIMHAPPPPPFPSSPTSNDNSTSSNTLRRYSPSSVA
ncbi:hypothetical protein BD560DRAFT_445584 [Blakeslea trispora]|nr:hypothetical protein BD560DRAFT_445584 [Blakeslea trispora]